MTIRMYVFGAIGFVVGFLIGHWFLHGAESEGMLFTLLCTAAFTGALAGVLAGRASSSGNHRRAVLVGSLGVTACVLVGVAIAIYRWIVR